MESNEQGASREIDDKEWIVFPGGELEGERPKVRCACCREKYRGTPDELESRGGPICFQCYRAALDRGRTIAAAGLLDTASEARFQSLLPFEPVNRPRLAMLRAERGVVRAAMQAGDDRFAERRRQAQIAARDAVELDRGPAPDPGSVARGGPTPRAAPSRARCAHLGPLYGHENKILVRRRIAVQLVKQGLGAHGQVLAPPAKVATPARAPTERERLFLAAIHAAELQLPESWLRFVVAH